MTQATRFLYLFFDHPAPLQPRRDQRTEICPDQSGGPTGQHVGRVMHAEIDAADPHNSGQQQRTKQEVNPQPRQIAGELRQERTNVK